MGADVFPPLKPMRDAWLRIVRIPARRLLLAIGVLTIVVAFLVSRRGSFEARAIAAVLLVGCAAGVIAWQRMRSRRLRSTRWVVEQLVGPVEPDAAGKLVRALSLLDDSGTAGAGTSPELARLHVERSVNAVPQDRVLAGATRRARQFVIIAAAFGVIAILATLVDPWAVFEGADILFSRAGEAPLPMEWVEEIDLHARPPEYLHLDETRVVSRKVPLPRGTLLTLRGRPTHAGRRLLLSDGKTEVPLVDDGSGRVVARWPLVEDAELRVVARFGAVVIEEPQTINVVSIPDTAPEVKLEGAPKKIALGGDAEVTEVPIRYEASDDHGLREVHLVLRSGSREERRVLAKLDGETKSDRGGYVLRATDSFVKKSSAPVDIVVEAKDNDPITGPKWGASPAITLVPPNVGEPEARRIEALRKLRDALVDRLAWRLEKPIPPAGEPRKHYVAELVMAAEGDSDLLDATLTGTYAGLRISGRIQAMLRAQARKLDDAVRAHARAPTATTQAALVKANERFALVVDATLRGQGIKDAKDSAKRLVDVGEDLVTELSFLATSAHGKPTESNPAAPRHIQRVDETVTILSGSSAALKRLGSLGRDLGGAVEAALVRVARARTATDLPHAELAARDLVARLRRPDPSFGSSGSGQRAGGEAGGGRGVMDEGEDEPSDAERAFSEAEHDLEQLIGDHAAQRGETASAMSAESPEELKAFAEEAKKHADAVRESTSNMPSVGGGSDSWTSKGAAAREHAEQMARSLEQGSPSDAVQSGKNALQALEEAKRLARSDRWSRFGITDSSDPERRIDEAKKKLEPEIKWAEDKLETMRRHSAERASGELQRSAGKEQKLAERMRDLADKGKEKGNLPAPAIDSLESAERAAKDAARALQELQAERGLERQGEAQRMLEMAREAMGDDSQGQGESQRGQDDGNNLSMDHADIPKADAHKGPEEFRRRVIQGLGQPANGRLKDAIRRYAEGLLR